MFYFRLVVILHFLNKYDKSHAQNGYIGSYAKFMATDKYKKFCFKDSRRDQIFPIKALKDFGYCTFDIEGYDRIYNVSLTWKGQHYIASFFYKICSTVVLPIFVSAVTTLILLYVRQII